MKNLFRRGVVVALVLAMALTSQVFANGAQETATASTEKVTISVWAWDVALMQLKRCGEEFQKIHPNVEFEFEEMGTDQVYSKIATSLATGHGIADVILLEGEVLAGYAEKFPEGFLDMSDVVNEADFLPVKVGEVKINGKLHAFPWDAGPVGLFYRKDYFEQAGVDPNSLLTWDDFIEAGKKVCAVCKTPSGEPVKMVPIRPTRMSLYATIRSELGVSTFDDQGNTIIDCPESIQAMKLFKKIYDSGIGLNFNGWDEYEGVVVNETVATIPEAVWMIGTIKSMGPQTAGKWGVVKLPQVTADGNGSAANGGSCLAVNAKSEVADMAKEFVKFAMTDIPLQAEGFKNYGLYPSYIPSYTDPVFEEGDEFFGGDHIYDVFIEAGKTIPEFPANGNASEASDMIGTAVSDILLNGDDVDARMATLQSDLVMKFGK